MGCDLAERLQPIFVCTWRKNVSKTVTPPDRRSALTLSRVETARLVGVSEATWDRLNAAGKIPSCVRIGGRVLWRVADIEAWIDAGCPDRKSFEADRH